MSVLFPRLFTTAHAAARSFHPESKQCVLHILRHSSRSKLLGTVVRRTYWKGNIMSFTTEERGNPNTLSYRVYFSKYIPSALHGDCIDVDLNSFRLVMGRKFPRVTHYNDPKCMVQ